MSADAQHPNDKQSDELRRDRSLASGLAWTAGARWSAQVLSWISTLIVANLLVPDDYGLIGMAAVYLGIVQLVSEFGLGTALIQRQQMDDVQISRVNGLSVLIGFTLFGISVLAAPILAWVFREPDVRPIVVALATTFVITSLQVVPGALLARSLEFRRLAMIESADALTQTITTLALAYAGAGYWALVVGSIAGKTMSTSLLLTTRGHAMTLPSQFSQVRDVLTFGWQIVASRLLWYGYSNADFVVLGRMFGKGALGVYSFGWQIASLPADKISGILARVMVPVFAEVQGDSAALQRYLIRLTEALVVVALPASIGMALVSADFVETFLGDHWIAATIPLALLSIHVTVRCVTALFSQVLIGIGDTRQSMRVGLWLFIVMPALFVIGAKLWGPSGVALMWLVGHPLVTFPSLIVYVSRRIEMPLHRLADAFGPAVMGTAVMALVVEASRALLAHDVPVAIRLAISVAVGALAYPALMWLVYRERMRSLIGTLQHLRR